MHPDFNPWLNGWGFFVCTILQTSEVSKNLQGLVTTLVTMVDLVKTSKV
jgi:hypothetical protein